VERFAEHAAPPLDTVGPAPVYGWVSGRHLLERSLDDLNIMNAGFFHLHLLMVERKIPRSLLMAECRMEELAQMAATGNDGVSRKTRMEIRRRVEERLLPKMPPQLTGIPVLHDPTEPRLFAGALSATQVDLFTAQFHMTQGVMPVALDAPHAALVRAQIETRQMQPTSFVPDVDLECVSDHPGHDFLTWLWFAAETRGGVVDVDAHGRFAYLLEGPLTFIMEGDGAHEMVLRKGQPLISAEAKTALLSGKKLKSARLTLVQDNRQWQATVDGAEFVFRSVKLPEPDSLDAGGRFEHRVRMMQIFADTFFALYDEFLRERRDASKWRSTLTEVGRWIKERQARK
jgi:hypothetical protein